MTNNIVFFLNPHIIQYFHKRPKVIEVWQYIQNNPDFTIQIGQNINKSVSLFNTYRKKAHFKNEELLKSSVFLKRIIKHDLPSINNLFGQIKGRSSDISLIENILKEIDHFDFIETFTPIRTCAGTLLLGSYRSAVLVLNPYLKTEKAQVASSLEEMIALIRLNGEKTMLFDCVKSWYIDYEEEGFTKELSVEIQNLQ